MSIYFWCFCYLYTQDTGPQRPEAGAFCNVAAAYNQIWHLAGGLGEFLQRPEQPSTQPSS